ncbi:hypothetical protein R80B4_02476 [Fibrobacteres bacterium R8-0-B4]
MVEYAEWVINSKLGFGKAVTVVKAAQSVYVIAKAESGILEDAFYLRFEIGLNLFLG